jgi:hypothetical protein
VIRAKGPEKNDAGPLPRAAELQPPLGPGFPLYPTAQGSASVAEVEVATQLRLFDKMTICLKYHESRCKLWPSFSICETCRGRISASPFEQHACKMGAWAASANCLTGLAG